MKLPRQHIPICPSYSKMRLICPMRPSFLYGARVLKYDLLIPKGAPFAHLELLFPCGSICSYGTIFHTQNPYSHTCPHVPIWYPYCHKKSLFLYRPICLPLFPLGTLIHIWDQHGTLYTPALVQSNVYWLSTLLGTLQAAKCALLNLKISLMYSCSNYLHQLPELDFLNTPLELLQPRTVVKEIYVALPVKL